VAYAHVSIADDGGLRTGADFDSCEVCRFIDEHPNMRLIELPFDSGVSEGRNRLIRETQRPFLLILDDDYCFTENTRIEQMLDRALSDRCAGIVGGLVIDVFKGRRVPRIVAGTLGILGDCLVHTVGAWHDMRRHACDYVSNFGLFRREIFDAVAWRGGGPGAMRGECDHLRQRIQEKFAVHVTDPNWQHWNGGVFLFDPESTDFLDTWHEFTRAIFQDPLWRTRDQGTLVATVWRYGLQNQETLDQKFNRIVDSMRNIPTSNGQRAGLGPASFCVDTSYALSECEDLPYPWLLHMINGSVGAAGWKNWDDAAALLARIQRAPEVPVPQ
jgi:hypothetical protein